MNFYSDTLETMPLNSGKKTFSVEIQKRVQKNQVSMKYSRQFKHFVLDEVHGTGS